MAAIFGAAAVGVGPLIEDEGWVLIGYPDPAIGPELATACAGVTEGIKLGRKYSEQECQSKTAQAFIKVSIEIAACLPDVLPAQTRAAFGRWAYNLGSPRFCASQISAAARAGNLRLACTRMNEGPDGKPRWIYAAGKPMRGLEIRRAKERAQCERGLAPTAKS